MLHRLSVGVAITTLNTRVVLDNTKTVSQFFIGYFPFEKNDIREKSYI